MRLLSEENLLARPHRRIVADAGFIDYRPTRCGNDSCRTRGLANLGKDARSCRFRRLFLWHKAYRVRSLGEKYPESLRLEIVC